MVRRDRAGALFMPLSQQDCIQVSQNTALPGGLHHCPTRTRDPGPLPLALTIPAPCLQLPRWAMGHERQWRAGNQKEVRDIISFLTHSAHINRAYGTW